MALHLRQVFQQRASDHKPVFVTFITAGFPHPSHTVDLLLSMQAGGADIIELGVPFSDPIADGPAIQDSNTIALSHDIDFTMCCNFVQQARAKGLTTPVILMGYYNPLMQYGEQAAVAKAKDSGVSGFIVVDLPPEEAIQFREICTAQGLSYVPLIAPSTTPARMRFLGGIADSFIYVVSKMGVTGASSAMSTALPDLVSNIRSTLPDSKTPLAVGFGVSNSDHFVEVGELADGVVIGSKLVQVIKESSSEDLCRNVQQFCESVGGGGQRKARSKALHEGTEPAVTKNVSPPEGSINGVTPAVEHKSSTNPVPGLDSIPVATADGSTKLLPPRFGNFGGAYVPEALVDALSELADAYTQAKDDPDFIKEYQGEFGYINRPSQLYEAKRLSEHVGGAKIWFKREDLNHTGSHKINNAIGQILLARRIGKKRIIAETGAGQHGVATATVCAKFGMECIVYMGAEDVRRQALNVFRMRMLGAKVVAVESGSKTLKDAINEAMRDWVTNLSTTHYLVGSAIGPHPFPTIVRDFQSVIGSEIKEQLQAAVGKLPDAVVACVGGGSNSIGTFYPFVEDKSVRLVGVEAGGDGIDTPYHSATLSKGTPGVLHGVRTYILQSSAGQITETHSISAGLDYPGVGPEHSYLKDSERAEYVVATDEDALRGFRLCMEMEGIIPALETSHAVHATVALAKTLPKEANIVMCLSGRGDKDVQQIAEAMPKWADRLDWHLID